MTATRLRASGKAVKEVADKSAYDDPWRPERDKSRE
jgi:hypothetical protein